VIAAPPLGWMGSPYEVPKASTLLAPDDSSLITGIELFVVEYDVNRRIGQTFGRDY
jgi:hypothetical protein